MDNQELENRLVQFSVNILELQTYHHPNFGLQHLTKQLIRSSSSAALNYGEARGAASRRDFIHKNRIVLKELRESYNCLTILVRSNLLSEITSLKNEANELVSIFVKLVRTAERNHKN
ncbi:MAG: four helix bundle protein [Calditrichaeota bacterium]|nr:four helix bundle protein [Calditrichota bacterium]